MKGRHALSTDPKFEAFLARLYFEAELRQQFLKHPRKSALDAGLTAEQADALEKIDRDGLKLASRSFEAKRNRKGSGAAGH